jgi:DNA-directed RNA polymerase subunit RPC12/RpoP
MSSSENFNVVCPHCGKRFASPILEGVAERYRGFKCPHCKLFVAARRAVEDAAAA